MTHYNLLKINLKTLGDISDLDNIIHRMKYISAVIAAVNLPNSNRSSSNHVMVILSERKTAKIVTLSSLDMDSVSCFWLKGIDIA